VSPYPYRSHERHSWPMMRTMFVNDG
jgi:hypothetical protein